MFGPFNVQKHWEPLRLTDLQFTVSVFQIKVPISQNKDKNCTALEFSTLGGLFLPMIYF